MHIDNLTSEQCKILDQMWAMETKEELAGWFGSLTKEKRDMAYVLHTIMILEAINEELDPKTSIANRMLKRIGVKVAKENSND